MRSCQNILILVLVLAFASKAVSQNTVFDLMKNDQRLADQYYVDHAYASALDLYLDIVKKDPTRDQVNLRIAHCYYKLKQNEKAVLYFQQYLKGGKRLSDNDFFLYSESLLASGEYKKAIELYQQYLSNKPDDEIILKKLWRLNNIQFLYEDSLHYALREVSINTGSGELCAVPYKNGVVFLSNRRGIKPLHSVDASTKSSFYKLYFSQAQADSLFSNTLFYKTPVSIFKEFSSKFHMGSVVFYGSERKVIFTSAVKDASGRDAKTLGLYFASESGGTWHVESSFPFNSTKHSLKDPAISPDGKTLIFSCDMKGGLGGFDLYKSTYDHGRWSTPVNLGENINTPGDEVFPYLHHDFTLYFSSNGHAGLGGLDIFRTDLQETSGEVHNVGYPLNTRHDEFGITMDSLSTHGYISSNRKGGGFQDDIFEFDMDLQIYPLTLNGVIKYKEHSWSDSSALKFFPDAKLYLIDHIRNATVYESTSDEHGNFSIVIPYFSKYRIRVVEKNSDEHVVSLEIPKHRAVFEKHDIVIVKDPLKLY